jgi:2-C-methyl-D-erythritol 4-phosphate cytidylyltransferase
MNNVIIVAGGKGLRMGGDFPKQFIAIGGKPILMRTIEAFYQFDKSIRIIVVLNKDFREHWQKLCKSYGFSLAHEVVDGGENRFESVKNGLPLIQEGLVAVHDAVRPFVSTELIDNCFRMAGTHMAVAPVIEPSDSLRELTNGDNSRIVDRSRYRLVQTPQVFNTILLRQAYTQPFRQSFTDDASVVEAIGIQIHLVEGERSNIKITTPFDLQLAEVILKT